MSADDDKCHNPTASVGPFGQIALMRYLRLLLSRSIQQEYKRGHL